MHVRAKFDHGYITGICSAPDTAHVRGGPRYLAWILGSDGQSGALAEMEALVAQQTQRSLRMRVLA